MNDEFYIGWESRSAPGIARTNRRLIIGLLGLVLLVSAMLALAQRLIGTSVFEWGAVKQFSGVLQVQPYPQLLVPRPGQNGGQAGFSTYYLVAPFKFGLDREKLASFDGKSVSLQGTLIYRAGQTMVEAIQDSIKMAEKPFPPLTGAETIGLGRQTLVGEIVDSKCYLGVMNPGRFIPHRACAIRCISGGVPPVLVVQPKEGPAICLLLVSAEGKPVNQQVLDKVAEPLQITGEVQRQGDLLILRADPATYQRVNQ